MKKAEIIERGEGYKIYFQNGLYFVDLYKRAKFDEGFATLQGAIEHVYYKGLRESK